MTNLEAAARIEAEAPPSTAIAAYQRVVNPRGPGLAAVSQFEIELARYRRMASTAAAQQCPTADLDQRMQDAIAKMDDFRKGA